MFDRSLERKTGNIFILFHFWLCFLNLIKSFLLRIVFKFRCNKSDYFSFFYENGVKYTGNPKGKIFYKRKCLCPVALKRGEKLLVEPKIFITEIYGDLFEVFCCSKCEHLCRIKISTHWRDWKRTKKLYQKFKIRAITPM